MKKLFVSVPMKGRTKENIKNSIEKMHQIAELMFGEKLEVIDSYVEQGPPKDSREAIWYLGESIKKMSEADYFIGIDCVSFYNGCELETIIAREYHIPSVNVDMHSCSFLADAVELMYEHYNVEKKCNVTLTPVQ